MKKNWRNYIKNSSSIDFVIEIPLNEQDYIQKILEFDAFLFEKGAQYGILNFIEAEKINRGETQKYINEYVSYRKQNMFRPGSEYVALAALYNWDYNNNLVDSQSGYDTMTIPVFENGEWQYESVNLGILGHSSMAKDIDETADITKNKVWNNIVEIEFHSFSNIWYDEIEDWQLDYFKSDDSPVDNRPVAYRISPRFNSFLRDLKAKTYSLGGKLTAFPLTGKISAEGYILLDGKIIFQEDIDSGRIKLPD